PTGPAVLPPTPREASTGPVTGSPGCANGWLCSAARCRPARRPAAASWSQRCSRWVRCNDRARHGGPRRDHPAPHRRRPGDGAGASGFLLKDATAAQLVDAVRVVAAGDALLAPSVTRRLIADFARQPHPGPRFPAAAGTLTQRETEVLRLIAHGLSNTEISSALVIAEQTTKTHVGRILAKLDLRDRAQAVVFAYETGLVTPGGSGA